MEMNTRLQVEHPVTEAVTGLDLVEWQLRVAAGETLPFQQEEILQRGHAIELRLYAENPDRGFLPSTGILHGLRFPEGEGVRVDTGVREGDAVTPFYDPLIAKIIAYGENRETARLRLVRALGDTAVLGLATNLGFLARVVTDADFAAGALDTGFIERRRETLLPEAGQVPNIALAAAGLHHLLGQKEARAADTDPWSRCDGWRLNTAPAPHQLFFRGADQEWSIEATGVGAGWRLRIGERDYDALAEPRENGRLAVTLDGARSTAVVLDHDTQLAVFIAGEGWQFDEIDPLAPPQGADVGAGRLTAPMPGRVIELLIAPRAAVRKGQALILIEAMKMEHTIAAPREGFVAGVNFAAGDLVEEGAELIALEDPDAAAG